MTQRAPASPSIGRWLLLLLGVTSGCTDDPTRPNAPAADGGAGGERGGAATTGGDDPSEAPNGGAGASPEGGAGAAGGAGQAPLAPWVPVFERLLLSPEFLAESADVGDVDGDGALDVIAGPRWYAGPEFTLGGELHPAEPAQITRSAQHFFGFLDDVDADGDLDFVSIGVPNSNPRWYEHPKQLPAAADWPSYPIHIGQIGNESPAYVDLVGDSKKELVFMPGGRLGYAMRGEDPRSPWTFHAIAEGVDFTRATHGLGVGDVDGDGLADVVEPSGVWLQRAAAEAEPAWERVELDFRLGGRGGAQMHVYDIDGDADSDVVTSLDAHGYGLFWFEQTSSDGALAFTPHEIMPATATATSFSQLHALQVADMNGDGLLDVITGKRYYAHNPPQDPGGLDPAVLYWFELQREPAGVRFVPHLIDDDSGVGCTFAARDVNADGKPDLALSSKKGTFLLLQR